LIDVAAYFERIGFTARPAVDVATLSAIHAHHMREIPFENLDPLLGRPVDLAPEALTAKLIRGNRGGYCFEQNGILHAVLNRLGYRVAPLAGRVIWMAPPDAPRSPLSHRLIKVSLPEAEFLVDVGFGGQSPTAPLRLELGLEQETPHGRYRFVKAPPALELQMSTPDGWRGMYRFTLESQSPADYEVANWFTATHPRSRFRQMLVAARIVGDTRVNLLNRSVTVWRGMDAETTTLESPQALGELLSGTYGLALPAPAEAIWAKLPP
jgi:arylamine N-acetyltransferase